MQQYQVCFWTRDLGRGVCLCVFESGEAVIVSVSTAGKAGAPAAAAAAAAARYLTALHLQQSKQNTHRGGGYARLARRGQVTKPPRHNGVIVVSLGVCGSGSLLAASCTLFAKRNISVDTNRLAPSSFVFHDRRFLGIP